MNDYILLLIVAVIGLGGGLFLLREARKYKRNRSASDATSD